MGTLTSTTQTTSTISSNVGTTHTHVAADTTDFQTTVAANADVAANKVHASTVVGNPHVVTKADVGLGNADNTSDVNKPVSTAQQTALNNKAHNSLTGIQGGASGDNYHLTFADYASLLSVTDGYGFGYGSNYGSATPVAAPAAITTPVTTVLGGYGNAYGTDYGNAQVVGQTVVTNATGGFTLVTPTGVAQQYFFGQL